MEREEKRGDEDEGYGVQEGQAYMRCGLHVDGETLARHHAVIVGEREFVDTVRALCDAAKLCQTSCVFVNFRPRFSFRMCFD